MKNLIIILLSSVMFFYAFSFDMQMFQQNGYNSKHRYTKFLVRYINTNYFELFLKSVLCIILTFLKTNIITFIICILLLLINIAINYIRYDSYNKKLLLKYTKRVVRLTILEGLLYTIFCILIFKLPFNFIFSDLLLLSVINPVIILINNFILKPVEIIINKKYEKKAKNKLSRMINCNVIGITGSYGKTSTKHILNSILSVKYRGFYTPGSYNTPSGNIITINNEEDIFNEYFISEMGAKKNGEIKEICDIVNPKYAIITCIGKAHLEFFKTIDNICNTKFELVESLPLDGIAILNKDDEYQVNYHIKNKCKTVWIGIDNEADIMAKNIKITSKGTQFDLYISKTKEKIKLTTVLLGKKNIYNILASCALALNLGISKEELKIGVNNIESISHRLEIKNNQNITIIDDSYNSNPEGAKNALEVLSMMNEKKYIITPGMIELGKSEYELNKEFGKNIADVCDEVYLIGKNKTKPILDGLKEAKYNDNNICVYNQFKDAYNDILRNAGKENIVILIENDLPDSYTER